MRNTVIKLHRTADLSGMTGRCASGSTIIDASLTNLPAITPRVGMSFA